jgi:hypothetical protein
MSEQSVQHAVPVYVAFRAETERQRSSMNMVRPRTKMVVMAAVLVAAWYVVVLVLPSHGHPQRALPVRVYANLEHLAKSAGSVEAARAAVSEMKWRDGFNEYHVQIIPDGTDSWTAVAMPCRVEVGMPIWSRLLLLDFYTFSYQTFWVKKGSSVVEEKKRLEPRRGG